MPAAADQSAGGAAGPLPPSGSVPPFPPFPYFADPRMMFPPCAGQQPNAMGGGTLNPNNPVMPPMFMPPLFMPNMQYNPFFMHQPWPPGSNVPPMYGSQVYPPGYPVPGYWPISGPFPPTATVPGIGAMPPPNVPPSQPLRSDIDGTTTPDQPSGSSVLSAGSSQQSSQNQSPSGSKETSISNRPADVETAPVSPPATGAESGTSAPPKEASSSAKQPPSAATFGRASASVGAEVANGEADDPVPSASQLRQRNVTQESSQASTGRLRRTNQPAELPRGQSSSSYNIGHLMLNILVAILVLCIVALLSRRLYLLG